jgi:hypothetical protein
MLLSVFFLGGLFIFGLPFLFVSGLMFGVTHTFGSLVLFLGLEQLFTGANLVTLFLWLLELWLTF